MTTRPSVRAGTFYEAGAAACRHHAASLLAAAQPPEDLPAKLFGGLVPHAGWVFSGGVAAKTFKALAAGAPPAPRIVLLGADHTGRVRRGEVYDAGAWQTPLGEAPVDEALAAALIEAGEGLRANRDAHAFEHSIEVQVPLVQVLWPEARIVPVAVPPAPLAVAIGEAIGRAMGAFPEARVVGSTDLTHHGGHFGDYLGHGEAGVKAAAANDRRMLDLIEAMDAEGVISEAEARQNACGAGAVAAAIAACRQMGARRAVLLEYTNSYEVMARLHPGGRDFTSVGYASVVFA